jgi:hypothetical protein
MSGYDKMLGELDNNLAKLMLLLPFEKCLGSPFLSLVFFLLLSLIALPISW